MNIRDFFNLIDINETTQQALITLSGHLGVFLLCVLLSIIIGRGTPTLVSFLIKKFAPKSFNQIYANLLIPLGRLFRIAGSLILIRLSLNILVEYSGLFNFLRFFADLALIISIAWLISRLFRQFVLIYGIDLINKLGREVDEFLLVIETVANIIIGLVAAIAFAQSQQINLVGILASLGIGGLAIAFAAQKTLEQLLGTVVLYLDRPYVSGEYIRLPSGLFGRVESIGIRSTKVRTAAKGTLMIIPNSTMANLEIENVSRSRKVMVLLYLNFKSQIESKQSALIEQVVKDSTNTLFGIDPGSTQVSLIETENGLNSRARITFFILGSSENSLQLRKRLLELARDKISKKLESYKIEFTVEEPTIYVESPLTL